MTTALLILLALAVLGLAYERWARGHDRKTWSHPGQLIDVGGHRLHARTYGEHEPLVVFEADEGAWSTHWGRIPEELGAAAATTVTYDRGGLGWSEPGPPPRDAETLARELHQLLARVAPGRPAVLVGHGTASHILRAYAHRYPFETAGLVLVDPFHDGLPDRLRREQIPPAKPSAWMLRVTSFLSSAGILRLLQKSSSSNAHLPLPDRQRTMLDALELDPRVRRGAAEEMAAEEQSLRYVSRLSDTHEIPMRILVSTETLGEDEVPDDFPREDYNRLWSDQSEAFLDLSRHARRVLVEGSGHQLQLERPEVVVEAVLDVLDEVSDLRSRPDEDAGEPAPSDPARKAEEPA